MEDSEKIQRRTDRTLKEIHNKLSEIEKSMPALSPEEAAFVRARSSYLTPKQEDTFAPVLNERNAVEELSYNELKAKAKELGINANGVKKEDLSRLIAERN